jgi:YD repeat-containing protein
MCPGVAVAGGGGGAGGGTGKGSKRGKGKKGAGTKKRKKSAAGGKKSGKSRNGNCAKSGSSSGCPGKHPANKGKVAAGDPIDIATGSVSTVPAVDLIVGGPNLFAIERRYDSAAIRRDVGLGPGWTHSLAWEIEVRRRTLRLSMGDGAQIEFPRPTGLEPSIVDDLVLVEDGPTFRLVSDDETYVFGEAGRIGTRHRLTEIIDRNGNLARLLYDDRGLLSTITDYAGRTIRVRRTVRAQIEAFEVETARGPVAFRTYVYDDAGDLVRAIDAEGHANEYAYEGHRLTSHRYPDGLTFFFRYDGEGRCVESYGDHSDPAYLALAEGLSATLADGETRARGILHVKLTYDDQGYREVVDAVKIQRAFATEDGQLDKIVSGAGVYSRTFDALGNELTFTDPAGATTIYRRDAHGNLEEAIDPLGHRTRFAFDLAQRMHQVETPDSARYRSFEDDRGNVVHFEDDLGVVVQYRYDDRGLLIEAVTGDGARTRFDYDAQGNRTRVVEDAQGTCEPGVLMPCRPPSIFPRPRTSARARASSSTAIGSCGELRGSAPRSSWPRRSMRRAFPCSNRRFASRRVGEGAVRSHSASAHSRSFADCVLTIGWSDYVRRDSSRSPTCHVAPSRSTGMGRSIPSRRPAPPSASRIRS